MIVSPLYITMGVKKVKNYYLNMNQYRVRHYQVNNNLKKKYKEIMTPKVKQLQRFTKPVKIEYRLFFGDHRLKDITNIGSIIDKFFQDCLVENGILEDDNYKHVVEVKITYGGYDKGNGRCEIFIN